MSFADELHNTELNGTKIKKAIYKKVLARDSQTFFVCKILFIAFYEV